MYKLVNGEYQLHIGEPYWMSEIGLGIGRYQGIVAGIPQEQGDRYLTPEEQAQQERTRAEELAQYLRSRGIDPDNLPSE